MLPFRFFLPITASDFLDKNKLQHLKELCSFLAVRTGLEPATPGVTGRYSNQLNYRTNCSDLCVFLERGCKGTQKIGISKFFAYFFVKISLFDLNYSFFSLNFRCLKFRNPYMKYSILYSSLYILPFGIFWKYQCLVKF